MAYEEPNESKDVPEKKTVEILGVEYDVEPVDAIDLDDLNEYDLVRVLTRSGNEYRLYDIDHENQTAHLSNKGQDFKDPVLVSTVDGLKGEMGGKFSWTVVVPGSDEVAVFYSSTVDEIQVIRHFKSDTV